jgi:uncharacterized protein (TIGR03435 family)
VAAIAYSQEAFEVASIKPHLGEITFSADPAVEGNRVTGTASTLVDLMTVAYHVRYDQISGAPGWAKSEHYDLEASAGPAAITREQMRAMLQTLLAERFQLRVHREAREVPMYALVVAKGGPKLREWSAGEEPKGQISADRSGMHMEVCKGTMAQLATRLAGNGAGRPVIDKTGLERIYCFKLDWVNDPGAESELPSLFVALEGQLGLRLEATKGAGEFIVIDRAARASGN